MCLAPILAAGAETYAPSGQSMPLFGRLGSARLMSLGGAFHALAQGPDALLANPAGLSSVGRFEVGLHHESWLADINEESLWKKYLKLLL